MRHQLKAVFTNHIDAQQVLDNLLRSGYPCSTTLLTSPPSLDETNSFQGAGRYSSIRKQLKGLFARATDFPTEDSSALMPGRHNITMAIASDPESVRAITILENSSALYIEDWRQADRAPDVGDAPTAVQLSDGRFPPGTAPGAMLERRFHSLPLFGTQRGDALYPHGATYQESGDS